MLLRIANLFICCVTVLANPAPPAFKYTPPDTITRREGEVLLLRCRAVGRPTPVITWLKDGWPIKNGEHGIRLSEGELAVASLQKIHKGIYSCKAQNVEGEIEQSTTVYIQGSPVFATVPHNATVKEGQDAMFSCKAEGYPTNILYTWFYNDENVENSGAIRGRYGALGDGTFIIYNVVAEDGGTVACRASNGFGEAPTASATLVVQFPARVSKMPSILYAGLSLKTILPCPAVAVPPVSTVTWHKDGQLLKIDQDERLSLGENGSLVISVVEQWDAARYTCIPYNILGTLGESTGVRLNVRYPPYFTRKPQPSYQAVIGKDLEVQCEGAGDPPPHVSWIKIDNGGAEEDIEDRDGRLFYESGNLTIHTVVKSDHGTWRCVLSNAVATVTSDVVIYVKYTTPHAVTNVSVVTSRHSAQVSWTPGYDGGKAQHFMIWYKRADAGDQSWQTQNGESYRKMATVSSLEADTIYQFALLPENVLGSGKFSKTITAKTKGIPPTLTTVTPEVLPPGRMDHHVTDDGLLLLMWQPPMDTSPEDLLGYVVEFRMLLQQEEEEALVQDQSLPPPERIQEAPLRRSKRSHQDPVPSTTAFSNEAPKPKHRWSPWATLAPVNATETSVVVDEDKLFRDQMYEFEVLAVSRSAYSSPSAAITVSTKGMTAYPVYVGPAPIAAGGLSPVVVAGIGAGVVFVVIVLALTSAALCHHKHKRKRALGSGSSLFEEDKVDGFDRKSHSKSESPARRNTDSKLPGNKSNKMGPLSRIKKKMLKADSQMGEAYSSTDEILGQGSKFSSGPEKLTEKSDLGSPLIRKISRDSDGKFHASDQASGPSNSVTGDPGVKSGKPEKPTSGFGSRPRSAEWDAKSPLLPADPGWANGGDESLEIDCSHSDIEVRYVKEGRGRGRCQSTSMSSLSGPRQYNLSLRLARPLEYSLDSSTADTSFTSVGKYQQMLPTNPQHRTGSHMPPFGQLPKMRGKFTPRKNRNPEYRVSSPPHFPDYNPTPGSPSKYSYPNHPDGYNAPPRDSYSGPADRLVYDPRFTRIEPIYEVGYRPDQPPNRHSSFVIDTRRELPNHPHPHRAIQIYRTGAQAGVTYPTPLWRNRGPRSHTMPRHQPGENVTDHNNVEASLLRHSANAASPSRKELTGTNSLSRTGKKSNVSPRRRAHSMENLGAKPSTRSDTAGSVDLLSPRRNISKSERHLPETESSKDITRDGCEAGDEASDVTVSSSSDSSQLPSGAVTSRNADSREDQVAEPDASATGPIAGEPTSAQADDSSAVSSATVQAPLSACRLAVERTSSGYDSRNSSQASDFPAPFCPSPNAAIKPPCPDHDRTSTASSSDRSRKDTSSVDEKYEWDSEIAMESEILEALRHFGTHKKTGSVSQALVDEIQKLGMDKLQEMGRDELTNIERALESSRSPSAEASQTTEADASDMYTKESMEMRCAALKREYQRYQLEQNSHNQARSTTSGADESVFPTNA